jgi:hypothetical protein
MNSALLRFDPKMEVRMSAGMGTNIFRTPSPGHDTSADTSPIDRITPRSPDLWAANWSGGIQGEQQAQRLELLLIG